MGLQTGVPDVLQEYPEISKCLLHAAIPNRLSEADECRCDEGGCDGDQPLPHSKHGAHSDDELGVSPANGPDTEEQRCTAEGNQCREYRGVEIMLEEVVAESEKETTDHQGFGDFAPSEVACGDEQRERDKSISPNDHVFVTKLEEPAKNAAGSVSDQVYGNWLLELLK